MSFLFEYGGWVNVNNPDILKQTLQDIWANRHFDEGKIELEEAQIDPRYQPFLSFDRNDVRGNNYVGFIQHGEDLVEIYPKVFRNQFPKPSQSQKELMLRHIYYWFRYCRKWRVPFNRASLKELDIKEFPELFIYIISSQFKETVSNHPLTMYQSLEEPLFTPRGSINFKRYINNSLSHGNFHSIECDYEPFLFDNKVNRIIKYCSRLLLSQTKFSESQSLLQDIIFILDEVEDISCTAHDVEKINLNSFYEDYTVLMDYSKLILNQQLYSSSPYDLSQWCLLFPMEYIFEDFLAGFMEAWFSKKWKVCYQESGKYLTINHPEGKEVFNMQHDIFLKSKDGIIIIDTKYKYRDKIDDKRGIAQSDLYQVASYAFRRGCKDVFLIYPNFTGELAPPDKFKIISGFPGKKEEIQVTALEIPFCSFSSEKFDGLEDSLKAYIETHINANAF